MYVTHFPPTVTAWNLPPLYWESSLAGDETAHVQNILAVNRLRGKIIIASQAGSGERVPWWSFTRSTVVQWTAIPMPASSNGRTRGSLQDSSLEIQCGRAERTSAWKSGTSVSDATISAGCVARSSVIFLSSRVLDCKMKVIPSQNCHADDTVRWRMWIKHPAWQMCHGSFSLWDVGSCLKWTLGQTEWCSATY